jgi:multimeric flavodoxin WrbA
MADIYWDFSELSALYFNGTLTKSPQPSHTDLIIDASKAVMEKQGVKTEVVRTIDYPNLATGIYPDMTGYGYDRDDWPEIYKKVMAADILVIAGPIWLGDNSSMTKKIIERLYGNSSDLNPKGQWAYYGKAGGCLITGNEDGVKHCAQNILYSLQHLGYTIPPQADAGWIGEVGPGPSYGDTQDDGTKVGLGNDFTNRNTTFMTWNLMHLAKLLKVSSGYPAYGNLPDEWKQGNHYDFSNPEYR